MLAVIQRVSLASVAVKESQVAAIDKGLVIFLGLVKGDTSFDAQTLAKKIIGLRIFNDQNAKMNLCAKEVGAQILVISQFTLCADLSDSGRRPSFDRAAPAELAEKLYLEFIGYLKDSQLKVEQGIFKEYMAINVANDGPATFILNTKER